MSRYDTSADWYVALANEVGRTSQNKAATRIGVNASYINMVLNDKPFPGRLDRFIARIEGALLHQTVMCPVVGEMSKDVCESHQSRPFSSHNTMRVRIWKACNYTCTISRVRKSE